MNYTPIRISTLKPGIDIPFRLFIYFKETYLEYTRPGSAIEKEKYKKLKKQKIAKFYIADADEGNYQTFIDELLNETLNNDDVPVEEKVDLVTGAAETGIDKLQKDPESEAGYNMTTKAAKNLRMLVFSNSPQALQQIFGADKSAEPLVTHSLNVAALSIKFAQKLKFKEAEIDILATAALMHDIGVVQLPEATQELFEKKRSQMTPQERLEFWEHTNNVTKLLYDKPYANADVISLIKNHEENRSGTGPNKKKKLEPLEELLSLVNSYDMRVTAAGMAPADAIKEMMIEEMGNYDLKLMQDFQKLLKEDGLI